jgi:fructoselysine-6-P-deglycase FrlB-like protein
LFNEVAKFPSAPMQAAQFRHGPVEIVDEHYRAIVFAPNDHTRALNIALADDLARLGGQARLIERARRERSSARHRGGLISSMVAAPDMRLPSRRCRNRSGAVRGLRLLRRNGAASPGEFRVATQVTSSETGF